MVRILALLLALLPTSALAQATFTTVISPTTLGTSPLGVTFGASPHSVICISGCAAGASPSSVIVTNQPTVTASLSGSPFVYQGTAAWQVNIIGGSTIPVSANGPLFVQQGTSPWAIAGGVNVNNTVTSSLTASPFVMQGTNPWTVNGTVSASLTTSAPYVNINTIPTVTTSAVAGAIAVNVNNTPTVSLASSPFVQPGTSPWAVIQTSGFTNVTSPLAVTLPLSPIAVSNVNSAAVVNVMAAGTSALAVTPIISPVATIVTSGGIVVNSAAGTSPLAVTLSSSPTAIAEQNALAYPNRANWKQGSVTTTGTASAVVIGAPTANKLYITALQCWRSDAGTSPITMRFNDPAAQFTLAVGSNGTNVVLNPALVMSATTSLQFSASTSLTSVGCNAQGYNNP